MQLGRKSNTASMFDRVKADLPPEAESQPLMSSGAGGSAAAEASPRASMSSSREAISVTVSEQLTAELSREGTMKSFEVKGDLQIRVSDPTFAKIRLDTIADASDGTQYRTHPNVDKTAFNSNKCIQLKDVNKPFPSNNSPLPVLRWRLPGKAGEDNLLPLAFTVWVNKGSDDNHTVTIEYELQNAEELTDVAVHIPYSTAEPNVSSFDADYENNGSELVWRIGNVDADSASGSFEFEAAADDDAEFFPMNVTFSKTKPFVNVDVSLLSLIYIPFPCFVR